MAKVVIYLRVSTADQVVDNQLPALQRWIQDRGHELVEVYSENESAWRAGHQRELARLFSDLPRRKVDIILCWSLDRLSREGVARVFELVRKFRQYGVQLVSYSEPWLEQSGEMAELLYAIAAWVAEFESRRRSERIKAGLDRLRTQGKVVGRKPGAKDRKKRSRLGYYRRYAN
jgi:putative DNA-invertase from lambdoid prophage Rac